MKKTVLLSTLAMVVILFTGCNNFFHEILPPDENRIGAFSVPGQLGPARIGDNTISVTVGPNADIYRLLPSISIPSKATLLPVTLPYIQRIFPSANVFQEGMGFYTSGDRAAYVIDLIKRSPDFTAPPLDEAIDFSSPVNFLVISGLGTIRQYTVTVEVDSGEGKIDSFEFIKFDNPDLTRGDATVIVNNDAKTITAELWYPAENIASYRLIPRFETNGAMVSLNGTELRSGVSEIVFDKPLSEGWTSETQTKTLRVGRPGFDPADYTLTVTFREDMDTVRSITDFRIDAGFNYGVRYTTIGEITNSGDTGSITLKVHHSGPVPTSLAPSFVSPGRVSVEGAPQTSGTDPQDFTQPLYYTVVSRDGVYTRSYRVTVDFVNEDDARPRIQSFIFMTDDNSKLSAASSGMIDQETGLIVIEAVYANDPPPDSLVPRFNAGGSVSVGGKTQQSGVSSQDFSRRVKYTVKDPGNPNLARDYWVETRFVRESGSLAEIGEFRFFAADNPGLCADVTATIDQAAGTINAVLPFDSAANGHRGLRPRWLAQGTVQVGGVVQESGVSSFIGPQTVYRVVSANGAFSRDYTVTVQEVNTRIYVNSNASGDNTGVSWANAFRSLADACKAAEKLPAALPAEVWIAEGEYRPSETRDTAAYFKVSPNTGYYGGFAGNETAKDQRVSGAHTVTISGDLGGGLLSQHLFMNTNLAGTNAAFGELRFTQARALMRPFIEGYGPAIHVSNFNNLTITNSVFEGLEAEGGGGAVYASSSSGSVSITDCNFKDTEAEGGGGAVYASSSSGSVSISGCGFENTTGSIGGAVDASSSSGSVSITDCNFKDTEAEGGGGAVYVSSSSDSVVIRACDFVNTQTTAGTRYDEGGGAVYFYGSGSMSIENCGFENTRSENYGGAVYAYSYSSGSMSITDCSFEDTRAGNNGGAVYASFLSNGSVTISGCGFETTRSENSGGAVYAYASSGPVSITACDFEDTAGTYGGAVYAYSSSGSVSISDCDFEDTEAGYNGGAVVAYSSSASVSITDCDFKDTVAGGNGGAVSSASANIKNCGFETTRAGNYGGAVYVNGGSLTIDGYTSNDTVAVNGGSLYISGSSQVSIKNASIANSQAINSSGENYTHGGGGIWIQDTTAEFTNVTFTDVKAQGSGDYIHGGAVFFSNNTQLTMTACSINTASSNNGGGAIGGAGPSSCKLYGVSFTNCSAPQGSLLYGNKYSNSTGAPAYTVGPGCTVNGTEITIYNWSSFNTDSLIYLINGATIIPGL